MKGKENVFHLSCNVSFFIIKSLSLSPVTLKEKEKVLNVFEIRQRILNTKIFLIYKLINNFRFKFYEHCFIIFFFLLIIQFLEGIR